MDQAPSNHHRNFFSKHADVAPLCNLIGHSQILPHETKIEYTFHQCFSACNKRLGIRLIFNFLMLQLSTNAYLSCEVGNIGCLKVMILDSLTHAHSHLSPPILPPLPPSHTRLLTHTCTPLSSCVSSPSCNL